MENVALEQPKSTVENRETFATNFERGQSVTITHEFLGEIAAVVIYQETTPAGNQCVWFEMPSGKIDFVLIDKDSQDSSMIIKQPDNTKTPKQLPNAKKLAQIMASDSEPLHIIFKDNTDPGPRALMLALNKTGLMKNGSFDDSGKNQNGRVRHDFPTVIFAKEHFLDEAGAKVPVSLGRQGQEFTLYPPTKNKEEPETYPSNHETQLVQYLLQSGFLNEEAEASQSVQSTPEQRSKLFQIARVAITRARLAGRKLPLVPSGALEPTTAPENNGEELSRLKQLTKVWKEPLESWLLNAEYLPNTLYQMAADPEFCQRFLGISDQEPLTDLGETWLRENKIPTRPIWKERLTPKRKGFSKLLPAESGIHPAVQVELEKIWTPQENTGIPHRQRNLPNSYYAYENQARVLVPGHPVISQGLAANPDQWSEYFSISGEHPTLGNTAIDIPLSGAPVATEIGTEKVILKYASAMMEPFVGTPGFPIQSQLRFFVQKNEAEKYQPSGFDILCPDNQAEAADIPAVQKLLDFLTHSDSAWGPTFQRLEQAGCLYLSGSHYLALNTRNKNIPLTPEERSFLEPTKVLKILNLIKPESIAEDKRRTHLKYQAPYFFGGEKTS